MSGPFAKVITPNNISDAGLPRELSRMATEISRALSMGLNQVRQDMNLDSDAAMAPASPGMN